MWLVRTTAGRFAELLLNLANLTETCSALEKIERKYIYKQKSNQFHCYNQSMSLVKRMDQKVAKHRIGISMKKWWWYPFVWMVDIVLQGVWVLHCIKWDKGDECLPLWLFEEMLSMQFFWNIQRKVCRNSKYPIRRLLW